MNFLLQMSSNADSDFASGCFKFEIWRLFHKHSPSGKDAAKSFPED